MCQPNLVVVFSKLDSSLHGNLEVESSLQNKGKLVFVKPQC